MDDREWEDADHRFRDLPFGRFVMSKSGTVRRPLKCDQDRVTFEEVVTAGRTPREQLVPNIIRRTAPEIRTIKATSWCTFTQDAVLLPDGWTPLDALPPQRFREAEIAFLREGRERSAKARTAALARRAAEADMRRALDEHLREQWRDTDYLVVSVQDDVLDQRHLLHYNSHPRARNWLARCWLDRRVPGGIGRDFLPRVPGNWSCSRVNDLVPGDYIEAGADQMAANGHRTRDRWYFKVLAAVGDVLLVRRDDTPPPLDIDEVPLPRELERFTTWLSGRSPELGERFRRFVDASPRDPTAG